MNVQRRRWLGWFGSAAALSATSVWRTASGETAPSTAPRHFAVNMTDAAWRKRLSVAQYRILRQEGTEAPYSSALLEEHRHGNFACAGCALALFASANKFDSGTGWPSFWKPLAGAVETSTDTSLGMQRNEVHCHRCGGHLGHVFDDGPPPTGLRYCMNGDAMVFVPKRG
ncbi:MAG: peptide-methionine (R)-S-oxide reductase MsrB [Pseudomonadota bacterium]|nr:peptide-methionine (R)-S-oxide reductase MsrB [Pseudomonadota bacterium]